MCMSLNEAEIMYSKALVYTLDKREHTRAKLVYALVVGNYRVHVYGSSYRKLRIEPLFKVIYRIVNVKDVLSTVHLGVK